MTATTLTRTDVLDVCAVMLQRCRLTAGELAAHMGEPLRTVVVAAAAPAGPADHDANHMTPRLLEVLDKCDCADGMSVKDLEAALGIAMQTAFEYLTDLLRMGRVTRVKLPGRPGARYFARPAHALAWVDSHVAALAAADAEAAAARATEDAAKVAARAEAAAAKVARAVARAAPKPTLAPKPKSLPMVAKAAPAKPPEPPRPTGEAINPNGIKPTIYAAAVDTRLQVKAGDPLTGGFSTSLPGINPLTGKAWGAAA